MNQKIVRLLTIGASMILSLGTVSGIFYLLGEQDHALQATAIAMLSASWALAIHPWLTARMVRAKPDQALRR
jgi:hypothetical protein